MGNSTSLIINESLERNDAFQKPSDGQDAFGEARTAESLLRA